VTLSLKNCFGTTPASIYGDNAGAGEPNEKPTAGREAVLHNGRRQPSKSAPPELHPDSSRQPGFRVPRIVADLVAARPIHLAIIDGVESIAGGEGPWIRGIRIVKPGVLIVVSIRSRPMPWPPPSWATTPRALRGAAPFRTCDNTLLLAEAHGIGTTDLKRIEVRGLPSSRLIPLRYIVDGNS